MNLNKIFPSRKERPDIDKRWEEEDKMDIIERLNQEVDEEDEQFEHPWDEDDEDSDENEDSNQ